MDEKTLGILLVPLALFGFVAFWCLILKMLSLGGWSRLHRAYPAPEGSRPEGIRFGMRSARLGGVNFSGSLTFIVLSEGLYLTPMFLFRPFHPALLVPWSAITTTENKWSTELSFAEHPDLKLQLSEGFARDLLAARQHLASAL